MKYTPEEQSLITTVLAAFESYMNDNPYFDVFHSQKHGYLYVRYEGEVESAEFIRTADELFERIIAELSYDVRDLFLCGEHTTIEMYPAEIVETRKRLKPYLALLPAEIQSYYKTRAEEYFAHCNDG